MRESERASERKNEMREREEKGTYKKANEAVTVTLAVMCIYPAMFCYAARLLIVCSFGCWALSLACLSLLLFYLVSSACCFAVAGFFFHFIQFGILCVCVCCCCSFIFWLRSYKDVMRNDMSTISMRILNKLQFCFC